MSNERPPESYIDVLVRALITRHPLPWCIEQDWTFEVMDANNRCFLKMRTYAAASELIDHADRLAAEDKKADEETTEFLRKEGIEP